MSQRGIHYFSVPVPHLTLQKFKFCPRRGSVPAEHVPEARQRLVTFSTRLEGLGFEMPNFAQ